VSDSAPRAVRGAAPLGPAPPHPDTRGGAPRRRLEEHVALTVHPADPVAEADRIAARSRLERPLVTGHRGRLVGAVTRRSLVHDGTRIREEGETR
jgi:CBS domain-containing protein